MTQEMFLKNCIEGELLLEGDVVMAERMLALYRLPTGSILFALCYMWMALRQGHVCVCVKEKTLTPALKDLLADSPSLNGELLNILQEEILRGFAHLPSSLLQQGEEGIRWSMKPLVHWNSLYYFQRYWMDESLILHHLKRLSSSSAMPTDVDLKKVEEQLIDLQMRNKINQEQAQAISEALQTKVALITGGPGTGKTYTAAMLLETLWKGLYPDFRASYEVVVAAPTGKAAMQLHASLKRVLPALEGFRAPKVMTLHRLLNIQPLRASSSMVTLSADLVIVDEGSMIDVHLMAHLLGALKEGARLVLLGDPHQLPSVEAGRVFADLCEIYKERGKGFAELKICMRTELKEIVDFAQKIKQGSSDLGAGLYSAVQLVHFPEDVSEKERQKAIVETYLPSISFHHEKKSPLLTVEDLESFRKFCVLSPLKQGTLGVQALNQAFFKKMLEESSSQECFYVPIIVTKNDYRLELFNGDLGVLSIQNKGMGLPFSLREGDEALFASPEGSQIRRIPGFVLPSFELAYCLSVHKSQGSEFSHVVLVVPEEGENFSREMLYTAVTRTRQRLDLVAKEATLLKIAKRQNLRCSGGYEKIRDKG